MVNWDGEEFGWEIRAANASALQCAPKIAPELAKVITDGFVLEVSPAAVAWWRGAAALLKSGRLLAIDYGFTREERLQPERHAGTLRAYAGHTSSADVLGGPGEQDLTAHVDFTGLEEAGLAAGLRTDTLDSQEVFLTRLFQRTTAQSSDVVDWTPPRLKQLQTLIHPAHLGRVFRVLVQTRV